MRVANSVCPYAISLAPTGNIGTCGGSPYDTGSMRCCNGVATKKICAANAVCCGTSQYDMSTGSWCVPTRALLADPYQQRVCCAQPLLHMVRWRATARCCMCTRVSTRHLWC